MIWKRQSVPKILPKYCKCCGKELTTDEETIKSDTQTGKPIKKRIVIRCPNIFYWYTEHTWISWDENIK